MAQIADVTVKAANGTTDVLYTALQGATASEPAIWQDIASSLVYNNRDHVKFRSRDNGTKTVRRMEIDGYFPVRRIENGVEVNKGVIPFAFTVPIPNWAMDAEVDEAVERFIKMLASSHIRFHIKGRYAPN